MKILGLGYFNWLCATTIVCTDGFGLLGTNRPSSLSPIEPRPCSDGRRSHHMEAHSSLVQGYTSYTSSVTVWAKRNDHGDCDNNIEPTRKWRNWFRRTRQRMWKPVVLGGLAFFGASHNDPMAVLMGRPPAAHASAPVMALPKAEGRDPASEALMEHERQMIRKVQTELRERDAKARAIEKSQGEAARVRFEKEYQATKEREAAERLERIATRKRELLDQGICPFTDLEGQRQITLLEKGVDLGEVSGTPYYMEKEFERKAPQKSLKVKKAPNRRMIALMVQDMKNRGEMDPVEYFKKHQERTMAIMDLPAAKAASLVQRYEKNLEEYGQITVPKEGEMSVKEKMAAAVAQDPSVAKEITKQRKAEEKAAAKAEREAAKESAKAAKEEARRMKQEEKAAKQTAKDEEKAAKAAAAAAAAASAAAAARAAGASSAQATANLASSLPEAVSSALAPESETDQVAETSSPLSSGITFEEEGIPVEDDEYELSQRETSPNTVTRPISTSALKKSIAIIPAAAVVVAVGGGGYALKMYRDKAAAKEEERKRQFRILMGEETMEPVSQAPALEEIDTSPSQGSTTSAPSPPASAVSSQSPPAAAAAKKRRLGIFNKKKSTRETKLINLVRADAPNAEFSILLAKMLTFGAPGRFPTVTALPGDMPMDTFDLEVAKAMLVESRTRLDMELETSAEVFANVVNCMLIDIVDLASTSLKEKENTKTVDAINIVVEFMNHAASLYDAVAGGASITPVVYEGDLSKSKLEQMYTSFAASGMMDMENLSEDFDSRVSLLQDMFQINEKKAEGLMLKAVQKQMMEMMKDGKGMEEMLKGMGGMEGMEELSGLMGGGGADGDDEKDMEQMMVMMRELKNAKDRGDLTRADLDQIRSVFKDTFGTSLESLDESTISAEDKEVLDMMKSILN